MAWVGTRCIPVAEKLSISYVIPPNCIHGQFDLSLGRRIADSEPIGALPCTDAIRTSRIAVRVYGKTMFFLFELYGSSSPMILVNLGSGERARFESGGGNVCDAGNDGAVHSGCRILCAIFGCAMQGVQTSPHWLLGASAT